MAAMVIAADIQPIFVPTGPSFCRRKNRSEAAESVFYAWKTAAQMGIHLAGGSDCPVESCIPLWGIHALSPARDHQGYPQGVWQTLKNASPLMEALALFTTGLPMQPGKKLIKVEPHTRKACRFCSAAPKTHVEVLPGRAADMQVAATYVGENRSGLEVEG